MRQQAAMKMMIMTKCMDPDEGKQYVAFVMPILDLHINRSYVLAYEGIMRLMSTIYILTAKPIKSNVTAMAYL